MLPGWRRIPCSIAHSDVKGRYVVTNEDASPGDVLMEDMPLVCTIDFESFPREIIRAYDSLPKPDPLLPTNLFPALHPARVILFSFTCPIQSCRRVHVVDTPLYTYLKHLKRHTHPIALPADILRTYQTLPGGPCLPILSPHDLSMPLPQTTDTTNTPHPNSPSPHTLAPPYTPLSPLHPCAAITPFLLPLLPTIAQLNRVAHACGLDVGFPQALCGSVLSVWVDAWHAIAKRPLPHSDAPVPNSEGVLVTAIPGESLDSDARLHPLSLDPYSPYSTLSLLLKPRPPFKHLVGINASRDSEFPSGNNDPRQAIAPSTISASFRPAPTVSPLSVFAMAMQPDAPMRARTRALYLKLSRMIVDILPMSLVAALGPGIATFTQNVQVFPKDDDFNHCVCESCVAVTDHGSCFIANVNNYNQQSTYEETSSRLEHRPSPSHTPATMDSASCTAPDAARETLITLLAGRSPSRVQLTALPTSIPPITHANRSTHTTHATMTTPPSTDCNPALLPPALPAECPVPSIIDSYTPPVMPPALATASPAGQLILALHTLCDVLDTNVFNADGASLPVDCGVYGRHMRAKDAVPVRVGDGCAQASGGSGNASAQSGVSLTSAKQQSSMSDDVTQHRIGHTIVPATTKFTSPLPLPLQPIPESGIFIFRIKIDCLFPRVAMMEHTCLPVAVVRECHGDDHGFVRYQPMSTPSSSTSASSAPRYSTQQATNSAASPSPAPISSPHSLPTLPPTLFRVVASLPLPRAAPVAIAYRLISGLPRSQRHKQTVDSYGFPCGCVLCQGFDVCRGCVVGIAGRQGGRREQDGDRRESSLTLFLPIHPENLKKLGYSEVEEHVPAETPEDDITALVGAPDTTLPLTTVFDPALKHRWLDCDLELIVRGRVGRNDPDLSTMTSTDFTSAGSSPMSHILCSYRCIPKHLKQTQSQPQSQLQPSESSKSSSTVSLPLYRTPLPSPSPSLWLLLEYLWWQVQPSLRAYALTRALMHGYYTRQGWTHASMSGSEVKPLLHIAGCTCETGPTAAIQQKCLSCRLVKIPIFPENIDIPEPEEDALSLTSPLSFPMPLPPVFSLPLPFPEQYVTAIGNPDQENSTPHPEFLPAAVPSYGNSFRTPTYKVSCSQQCSETTPANPLHLLGMPVPVPLPVSFLNPELQMHWVTLHSQAEKYFRERVSNEEGANVKKNRDSVPARGKKAKPENQDFREIPVLSVSSQHYTLLEAISQVFGMIHSSLGMPDFRYRVDIPETSSNIPSNSADDSEKRLNELIAKKFPSGNLADGSVCASLDSEFTPHLKFPQLYSLMTSSTLWKPSPTRLHQLSSAPHTTHPTPPPSTSSSPQDTQHGLTSATSPSSPAPQSTALPLLLLLASLQATQLLQYGPAHWAVVDTVALRAQVCSVIADVVMHRAVEIYDAVLCGDDVRGDGDIGHAFREKVDSVSFMREMLRRTLSADLRTLHLHQHQRHTLDSLFKSTLEQSNGTQDKQRLDVQTLIHSLSVLLSLSLRWRGAACALLARARVIGAVVADADKSRALQNMHGFQLVLLEESLSLWDGLVDSKR